MSTCFLDMELNNFHDIDPLKSQPGEILQNSNEQSLSVELSKLNFKSSFLMLVGFFCKLKKRKKKFNI